MGYETTPNKNTVRIYDKERIKNYYKKRGRKLRYIGLPSPELNDIIEWQEFIGEIFAIERDTQFDRTTAPHYLLLNASKLGLRGQLTLIRGELDDVLMAGKEFNGRRIQYAFDLAFFDFFGGILNKGFKRVKAIKKFIKNQKNYDFLLLMTFNLKYAEESEEMEVLAKVGECMKQFPRTKEESEHFSEVLGWYKSRECPLEYRQKIFVPYLLRDAEYFGYKVLTENPIYYVGYNNSSMVHFITHFTYGGDHSTHAVSEQTLLEIIDLDLLTVEKGEIKKCDFQAPKLLQ